MSKSKRRQDFPRYSQGIGVFYDFHDLYSGAFWFFLANRYRDDGRDSDYTASIIICNQAYP